VLRQSVVREGDWQLLECRPAWEGNWTSDCFIASWWRGGGQRRLVAVNFAANQSQCRVTVAELSDHAVRLADLMSDARFDRDGNDVASRGLYLDLPPWGYHVFAVTVS
jgi:hypothetical protein